MGVADVPLPGGYIFLPLGARRCRRTNRLVIPVDGELGSKALLSAYPDLAPHMREVLDAEGNVVGHKLSRNFAGSNGYRYLNHGEFIAETFKDALHEHARGIRRKGVLRPNLDIGDQGRIVSGALDRGQQGNAPRHSKARRTAGKLD